ncbi:MAG TPA: murein biosynthesis integral membrane protein MurJ [Nocardioidaceae bacterium]|nr:murein biosynthesis integral membrane protein MurJ [Nocardioidaceae bacterium]
MSRHRAEGTKSGLLSASALMAAGTIVSRVTGFLRAVLIVAAIGKSLDADLFTQANTIPNSLYILVAGGVFNVVLVPQLVRTMKNDPDGGDAYAQRVLTLGVVVLAGATAVLLILVPLIARAAFPTALFGPELAAQRESAYNLMRWCMPQVFFYGIYVLLGQMLNARERFGPMMWAPIVNNVIACIVLGIYMATYGTSNASDGFTTSQEVLLGLGSTIGIVLQALVLIPYLRAAGLKLRLRFDVRGVGLGHTLRLGVWTLAFVLVNQIAYFVVSRLAVSATTTAAEGGHDNPAGATVYQNAFLITQVPHAIITVSLVTATMPLLSRLAADGAREEMRSELASTLRLTLLVIVPLAVALACLGQPIATLLFSHGALVGDTHVIGRTIAAFAPGLVFFTVHYCMLRGFYADEDTRTPFMVQMLLAVTNILAALAFTVAAPPAWIAALLALAYGLAYLVGVIASATALSRRVGPIFDKTMFRFVLRLAVAVGGSALVMLGAVWGLDQLGISGDTAGSATVVAAVAGAAGALGYIVMARLVGLREIRSLLGAVRRSA